MADNFLEKRMEDLRSGRIDKRARNVTKVERVLVLEIPDNSSDSMERLVRNLRAQGKRVAFTGMNQTAGTSLARSSGAQYHPVDWMNDSMALENSLRLIWRSWRGLDRVIFGSVGIDATGGCAAGVSDQIKRRVSDAVERVRGSQPFPDGGATVYEIYRRE